MRTRKTSSPPRRSEGGREQAPAEGCAHSAAVAHDAAEAEVTRRGLDHLGCLADGR